MTGGKAIIFDLDGTLLDTLPDLTAAVNHTLTRFSFDLRTTDEVQSFIGNGVWTLLERAFPNGTDENTLALAFDCFEAYYTENIAIRTVPYKDIPLLLESLKKNGYRIGVASNKQNNMVGSLCERFFPNLVDSFCGTTEIHTRKPSPYLLLKAAGELGVSPRGCVYVGDSNVDSEAAANAGMGFIHAGWGYGRLTEGNAAEKAETAAQLLTIISEEHSRCMKSSTKSESAF